MCGRKNIRVVQRARGEINLIWSFCISISNRRAAGCTKRAQHTWRRRELSWVAANQPKVIAIERDPGNHRRARDSAARLAMTNHAAQRLAT